MKEYKHILLAVELNPDCDELPIKKAMEFSKELGAKLTLLHAIEHMSSYGAAYGVAAGGDIEEMLLESAKTELAKVGGRTGVSEENQLIKVGPAKFLILEEAERLGVDLLIVGSHGRHGIRLLLGSTANAVLHGARCDVLAIRVKGE